jgi:hypothetical protein
MADITGHYDIHGVDYVKLYISEVSPAGEVIGSLSVDPAGTENVPIKGTFDPSRFPQLQFNDAQVPGEIISITFLSGYPIIVNDKVAGLAGTWSEQLLKFESPKRLGGIKTDQGGWYADNPVSGSY